MSSGKKGLQVGDKTKARSFRGHTDFCGLLQTLITTAITITVVSIIQELVADAR